MAERKPVPPLWQQQIFGTEYLSHVLNSVIKASDLIIETLRFVSRLFGSRHSGAKGSVHVNRDNTTSSCTAIQPLDFLNSFERTMTLPCFETVA